MVYELPPLPYAVDALEPYISAKTLKIHHGVLQKRYVERLNAQLRVPLPLEQVIAEAPVGDLLNNSQQVFNHTFLWHSMSPKGGGAPSRRTGLGQAVSQWGKGFDEDFVAMAKSLFGSGYVWLVADLNGEVFLWPGLNADNPMRQGLIPLLTLDVWEHSYFLDYGAQREKYAKTFLRKLANWKFAEANYARVFGA